MLNSSTKEIIRTITMPIDESYKIINVKNNPVGKEIFIMTGITEAEYKKLKNAEDIIIVRGNAKFNITQDDIFCYGDIDFSNGSDDCEQIDTFNWLDNLIAKGVCIPSRYDYNKHECTTNKNVVLYTETFKNSVLCRYLHGCLGKPKYTLIFREVK